MKTLGKPLYIIMILTQVFSMTSFAETCAERTRNQSRRMGSEPIIDPGSMSVIYDRLAEMSPLRKYIKEMPKTYDEIFFQDKDFPAEEIGKRAEESEVFWSQDELAISNTKLFNTNYGKHFSEYGFDANSYKDLSMRASAVWKQLLLCNQNDINLVRKKYFMGNPCGADTAESASAVSAISELNVNYASFLRSSKRIESNNRFLSDRLMRELLEQRGDVISFTLPHQHPLLVQIQLQNWAVTVNSINEKPRQEWDNFFVTYRPSDDYAPRGQSTTEFANQQAWRDSILNSAVIAASNKDDNASNFSNGVACSKLGLWPSVNRTLFSFMKSGSYNALHVTRIFESGTRMENYISKVCGEAVIDPVLQVSGERYSRFALAHLYEMKRLFARYWDQKIDQPYEKAMKQSGVTPYQKLVCTE
jgi:hypothetical protein